MYRPFVPCLLAVLALGAPRVVIVLLVLFTDYIGRAFEGVILPFLGFLLLPTTTLGYAFSINENGSIEGIYVVVMIVGVVLDLGLLGGGRSWFIGRRR